MSFYSPYQRGPDIAGGMNDLVSQIMQMLMMKKMFPGQQQGGEPPVGNYPDRIEDEGCRRSLPANLRVGGLTRWFSRRLCRCYRVDA